MLLILQYWKQAVLGVLLLATLYYKHEYNNALTDLATFKNSITLATYQQKADNLIKQAKSTSEVTLATNVATLDMTRLNLNRDKSSHDMKALYETKTINTKHSVDNSVQSSTSNHSSSTIETASDSSTIAESERERYPAFATLEQACTIETIDYNLLRSWADSVCSIAVCE